MFIFYTLIWRIPQLEPSRKKYNFNSQLNSAKMKVRNIMFIILFKFLSMALGPSPSALIPPNPSFLFQTLLSNTNTTISSCVISHQLIINPNSEFSQGKRRREKVSNSVFKFRISFQTYTNLFKVPNLSTLVKCFFYKISTLIRITRKVTVVELE